MFRDESYFVTVSVESVILIGNESDVINGLLSRSIMIVTLSVLYRGNTIVPLRSPWKILSPYTGSIATLVSNVRVYRVPAIVNSIGEDN